jgi:hypothetical protein
LAEHLEANFIGPIGEQDKPNDGIPKNGSVGNALIRSRKCSALLLHAILIVAKCGHAFQCQMRMALALVDFLKFRLRDEPAFI